MTKSKWLFQTLLGLIPAFYAPALGVMITSISCDFESNRMKFFPDSQCFTSQHIIETTFSGLACVLLIFFGFGAALL